MASLTVYVPPKFDPLVKQGDSVKHGQTLAEISSNKESAVGPITLHALLEVKPKDAKKYLVKADGETVAKGEIIARRRGFFSSIRVKSPTNGILRVAKKLDGVVSIEPNISGSIKSPVRGSVAKVTEKVGIIIDTKSIVFTGVAGRGNAAARLFKVANGDNIFNIDKRVAGNIVFGDHFDEAGVAKIKALGGIGVAADRDFEIEDIAYIVVEDVSGLEKYVGRRVGIVNDEYGHYLIIK